MFNTKSKPEKQILGEYIQSKWNPKQSSVGTKINLAHRVYRMNFTWQPIFYAEMFFFNKPECHQWLLVILQQHI
jgi:hypothetical protein